MQNNSYVPDFNNQNEILNKLMNELNGNKRYEIYQIYSLPYTA